MRLHTNTDSNKITAQHNNSHVVTSLRSTNTHKTKIGVYKSYRWFNYRIPVTLYVKTMERTCTCKYIHKQLYCLEYILINLKLSQSLICL